MKKVTLALLFAAFIVSCGYKPTANMLKREFGQKIYVDVAIDAKEPENAPFIKDALINIVYDYFGASLAPKNMADTKVVVHYRGSNFYPIAYDQNGYVIRYRVTINAHFFITKGGKRTQKRISAIDEADVQPSALNSSALRIEAIKRGMQKVLDRFLAYATAQGIFAKR